jgi:hypothetical protein
MQIGFGDVIANILTGGVYYGVKTIEGATRSSNGTSASDTVSESTLEKEESQSGSSATEAPHRPTNGIQKVGAQNALARSKEDEPKSFPWVLSGDYLLNSETGQVWLIDRENLELLPIKKKLQALENTAMAINLEKIKNFMTENKDMDLYKMPQGQRKSMAVHYNSFIKQIDEEIVSLTKRGKPAKKV